MDGPVPPTPRGASRAGHAAPVPKGTSFAQGVTVWDQKGSSPAYKAPFRAPDWSLKIDEFPKVPDPTLAVNGTSQAVVRVTGPLLWRVQGGV